MCLFYGGTDSDSDPGYVSETLDPFGPLLISKPPCPVGAGHFHIAPSDVGAHLAGLALGASSVPPHAAVPSSQLQHPSNSRSVRPPHPSPPLPTPRRLPSRPPAPPAPLCATPLAEGCRVASGGTGFSRVVSTDTLRRAPHRAGAACRAVHLRRREESSRWEERGTLGRVAARASSETTSARSLSGDRVAIVVVVWFVWVDRPGGRVWPSIVCAGAWLGSGFRGELPGVGRATLAKARALVLLCVFSFSLVCSRSPWCVLVLLCVLSFSFACSRSPWCALVLLGVSSFSFACSRSPSRVLVLICVLSLLVPCS